MVTWFNGQRKNAQDYSAAESAAEHSLERVLLEEDNRRAAFSGEEAPAPGGVGARRRRPKTLPDERYGRYTSHFPKAPDRDEMLRRAASDQGGMFAAGPGPPKVSARFFRKHAPAEVRDKPAWVKVVPSTGSKAANADLMAQLAKERARGAGPYNPPREGEARDLGPDRDGTRARHDKRFVKYHKKRLNVEALGTGEMVLPLVSVRPACGQRVVVWCVAAWRVPGVFPPSPTPPPPK